ncbi:MAG: MFS transporter [Candidatus Bathyarchaeia archaeon]|jgi:MFS family permease
MFSSYRGLSKEAKLLTIQAIFPSLVYGMFYTDISYFLTTVQGLSYSFMGIVITTMGIATFASSIPLGIAADKYGRKKMLILGNVIAGIIIAVFAFTTSPTALIVAAVFEGISEAAFSASSGALLAENAGIKNRNNAFSLYGFANSMAFGIGSLTIPAIVVFEFLGFSNKVSHGLLYVTFAALSLASTVILLKVKESDRSTRPKKPEVDHEKQASHKQSRSILAKYVLTSAIIAFGAGMVVPLMTAWLRLQYGIPDVVSGPILGLVSIVIGVATLAGPPIAKKLGLVKAIVVTQLASTIFMFATPLSGSYIIASSVYCVRAFLMNMASPLSQSLIMGLVDEDERGMASGVNAALWRLPNALSTFVGAFLMSMGLLALPFFLASILYSISIALFWFYFRKTKMPEEKAT